MTCSMDLISQWRKVLRANSCLHEKIHARQILVFTLVHNPRDASLMDQLGALSARGHGQIQG
jgi:hypothetical protein